ncbi:MAG: class I SAM-dependent methyltransferase [Mucilaginibacter sp.]|uniref:class I SAM-dependent methyltransferase n=1 Tax=Mucilaginibacter sp. TaxID=1882438 RepID=UPI0034E4B21D
MIKPVKKELRKIRTVVQKALARNIDHLYQDSPYNSLIAQLDKKEDFENYNEYTGFRKSFEKNLLKFTNASYVKLLGTLYHFNRFYGNFSFREACTDHTGLNSRMRFSLEIMKHCFSDAKKIYLTEHDTLYHKNIKKLRPQGLITSTYRPGDVLHQDLTKLTFPDNSFDLCMSFEDIEHIPDYETAIKELYRVTKPGGHVLLSTPIIFENDKTIVRATINEKGEIAHLLPPDYHGDPLLLKGILCYYHFGWDLLDSFRDAGFTSVKIVTGYDISKLILDTLLFIVAEK